MLGGIAGFFFGKESGDLALGVGGEGLGGKWDREEEEKAGLERHVGFSLRRRVAEGKVGDGHGSVAVEAQGEDLGFGRVFELEAGLVGVGVGSPDGDCGGEG